MDGSVAAIDRLAVGLDAHRAGRLEEAETAYRGALAQAPDQPMAAYLLGLLMLAEGRIEEAALLLRHALALRPEHVDTRRALAGACLAAGWRGEAIDLYRAVLARRPEDAPAGVNLARALHEEGWPREALAAAEAVLARAPRQAEAPTLAEAWHVAGVALRALGQPAAALEHLQQAVRLEPAHARAWMSLGHVAADLDRPAAAEAYLRTAVAHAPDLAAAHASLGAALTEAGRLGEAVAACDRALELAPEDAVAHWHRGIAHLLAGDFPAGWADFEWRKRHPGFAADFPPLPGRAWDGAASDGATLAGRSILLRAEQGLGDTIQFARFVPVLAAMGARVMLACRPTLAPLLAQLPVRIVPTDTPPTDLWADLLSLPHLLGVRADTLPGAGGYLRAEPARVARWPAAGGGVVRVGLVWAGNSAHRNDQRRSLPARAVAAVLAAAEAAPCLRFASLQAGPRGAEAATLFGLPSHAAALTDFAETAAAIDGLDLVIAADTAVAHLAGAMGKPVWLLLPFAPDWRWMLGRDDTPWYASMRLFRQSAPGDWTGVAARVAAALIARYRDGPGNRAVASVPPSAARPGATAQATTPTR